MNPYLMLARHTEGEEIRAFVQELGQWHDEMVHHQRHVRRVGRGVACSETCPHAAGHHLWVRANQLLGAKAEGLTFLRSCVAQKSQS